MRAPSRLVRHRGFAAGVPHELRMGAQEVHRAYQLAAASGFGRSTETCARCALISKRARRRRARVDARLPGHLAQRRLPRPTSRRSALQRERFKRERRDVLDALTAASPGHRPGCRRLGARRERAHLRRLEAAGALRALVVSILLRADPRWEALPRDDATDLLESYGLRRKPGLLRCAGRAAMKVGARVYNLEDFAPTAHLPEAWAGAWVDALSTRQPARSRPSRTSTHSSPTSRRLAAPSAWASAMRSPSTSLDSPCRS